MVLPDYAELHCISNFTFLRGASHPEELVAQAGALGYRALALTDECSLAGVVRAHGAAKQHGLKLIIGSEFRLADGLRLVLLATSREGYGNLCELITGARRAAAKGRYCLTRQDLVGGVADCLALLLPSSPACTHQPCSGLAREKSARSRLFAGKPAPATGPHDGSSNAGEEGNAFPPMQAQREQAGWLAKTFPQRAWIAVELLRGGDRREHIAACTQLGRETGLPLVAAGDVHMHVRGRRVLQDTLTAVRLGMTLREAGYALHANGERHLRERSVLANLFSPSLLAETLRIAERCNFSLDELRYEYPRELVPAGRTPAQHLRILTEQGIRRRWPQGVEERVRLQIEHELALIAELAYEPYFLTVHDVVRFARRRGILCQGRGSAANSAVCFCLGITEVDPARMEMLFERFISRERNEPPDIDVDFEHERREEVIQYLYGKYGRERAALAATVITYRTRSALRDVGKALGLSTGQVDALTGTIVWWDGGEVADEGLREAGLDPANPVIRRVVVLARALAGFPRHLSQHVGGFVIARGKLSRLAPIENAAMGDRTVIQWDKDDLDALGLLKVDCLALGMLSAIRRSFDLIHSFRGERLTMATIPAEDPRTYAMIRHADTVGVFQIESRAQMAMLPRLKPACFYDLVIEVAIVRPGPIQGDMVHPYLRRRQGLEEVTYPSAAVRSVLERTLGVPIFQEQVIQLAVVAAGFSPGDADGLRRSMAAWRRRGGMEAWEQRLLQGMGERGYAREFAQRICDQIKGFGEYGFPESHAASFALLAYVSAWLKCHEPAAFTCALLNSQPMGFYAPAQLVQDARRHGVEVRPVDVRNSGWDHSLEAGREGKPALRLGLRGIKGLSAAGGQRLVAARRESPFPDVEDLARRACLDQADLAALVTANALAGLAGNRHQALWAATGMVDPIPLPAAQRGSRKRVAQGSLPLLRPPTEGEEIAADYASLGLTLGRHPLALLRRQLEQLQLVPAQRLAELPDGSPARTGGLVITRQRPGSAAGVVFLTLEDETGHANIIVRPRLVAQQRRAVLYAGLLAVSGRVQREGEVLHVIARRLEDHSALLGCLQASSRDFR